MSGLNKNAPKSLVHIPLGHVVATGTALAMLTESGDTARRYLERHRRGDWGDLDPQDARANDRALADGSRLFSSYQTAGGTLWIITEADRSSTCLMLPSDY